MKHKTEKRILAIFLSIFIVSMNLPISLICEEAAAETLKGRLEDGGFENLSSFTTAYSQFTPGADKPWKTTAVTNKIELFRTNIGTYIKNVVLKPSEGTYAAELNADEESSMYQIVNTEPSSLYEWGLDHGARTESETMALIIGPNQDIAPSKSWGEGYETSDLSRPDPTLRTGYKYGRDQMMQMVDWLKATGVIGSTTGNYGIANNGEAIILYSKKFGEHGTFLDNMDNQPFSMTPSSVYTEKWYIWLMTDQNTTVANAENPWTQYGVNGDTEAGSGSVDLSKYYLYYVPSGQTKTLFAFTSVDNTVAPGKTFPDPTYGNFLDNVNFNLYRLFSGSSTSHGTVIMGHSNGTAGGEGGSSTGHVITSDSGVSTYIPDGDTLHIQAIIENDEKQHVRFAGIYYTTQDETGTGTQTHFVPVSDSTLWTETEDAEGNLIYSYDLPNVTSALNLHFVFVKSPLITYDVNGGKPYLCTPSGSNVSTEPAYVYSFMPGFNESGTQYVSPYTSHAPEGQNDGWKFTGWKLFDDTGEKALLPDVHTIACSYQKNAGEGVALKQQFTVVGGTEVFQEQNRSESGIEWVTTADKLYDDSATGLVLVAQWRWRQIFSPQTDTGAGYIESNAGGNVSVLSASGVTDENYDPAYNAQGAKAYFAEVNETVSAKATPEDGYYFAGWYDADGNLVETNDTLTYVEAKENMSTYYARFAKKYTQKFKRQIQSGGTWTTLEDYDTIIPLLDHAVLNESKGTVVSSTATNNTSYGLIGWYDASGNPVDQSMLYNDGKTIRYPVAGNAVYYARYKAAVNVNFQMQFKALDGTLSTLGTTNNYGSLSTGSISAITGETIQCKAYPNTGYKFVGWFDGPEEDATQVTFVDPADSKVIKPVVTDESGKTYYARFTARDDTRYIVYHNFQKFDTSGNPDGYTRLVTNTYYGTTGELVTPTITPKLYEEAQKGYIYSSGIETLSILPNGNLTFNLYYTKTAASLTYDSNAPAGASVSGTVAASSGYVGHTVKVSADQYSITGYRFNGWNTKADGTGTSYDAGDEYTLQTTPDGGADPNVLYAQWVPETSVRYEVHHIKLDHEGNPVGTPDIETHYGVTGEIVTPAVKSYKGYSLKGTAPSGTVLGNGNLVLEVYYEPNPAVLTYKANGGIGADHVENGVVNQSITVTDAAGAGFSRPGYTFTGWKTQGEIAYAAGSSYVLSADENVLLAQWSANTNTKYTVNHYKVSLDGLSAVLISSEEKTGKTGSTATATPAAPAGYTYKSDFNSNGMKNSATGIIVGDGSLILNLYYIPSTAKLSYDSNGGTGTNVAVNGRTGETAVIEANMFSRAGYTFTGWNTTVSAGTGTAYAPDDIYTFNGEDITLYAQWSANTDTPYKVQHYKTNAAGSSSNLVEEESIFGTTDTDVTATPKSYSGYHLDDENPGKKAEGTIVGNGSLVLKLYYKPDAVALTYKTNGGNGDDVTVNSFVDETVAADDGSAFSREGYTFAGWNTEADGSGTSYAAGVGYKMKVDGNVLYAQWNANPVSPPSGPVTPIIPITPAEPSDPADPVDPADPADPSDPEDPDAPETPSAPDDSGKSEAAGKPGDSQHGATKPEKGGSAFSGSEVGSYENMSNGVPKTGDTNDLMMWLLIMMASQTAIVILLFRKIKE